LVLFFRKEQKDSSFSEEKEAKRLLFTRSVGCRAGREAKGVFVLLLFGDGGGFAAVGVRHPGAV
jgi:hypothetical protein